MGTSSATSAVVINSLSMPLSLLAFTRREMSLISWRLWPRLITPRLLYIRLKFSSWLRFCQSFRENS